MYLANVISTTDQGRKVGRKGIDVACNDRSNGSHAATSHFCAYCS
jgi:hypothetical protein